MFGKEEEIWITNISRVQDISIGDLRITIRSGQSINLLSKKKNGQPCYTLTRELIEKSIASGSIFKKRNVIKVRNVAPIVYSNRVDTVSELNNRSSTRLKRKPTEIEILDYPDLELDDGSLEEFAAENADMDFSDRQPILAVDPMFKKPTVDDE